MRTLPKPNPSRRLLLQVGCCAVTGQIAPARATSLAAPPLADGLAGVPGSLQLLPTRNTFVSQNAGLPGWEYAFGKLVDDYSGGVYNPWWGPLGAMVFHGGGHSATFDNSVVVLDLNDLTFKRLSTPTPSQGGRFWVDVRKAAGGTDTAFDVEHCEYGDGQPGAGHSYDTLAILPPDAGGAACGSLLRVASFAVHVNFSCNTGWAHRFDFSSTAMRDGRWVRASTNGMPNYLAPGACSAYDTRRRRVWWLASLTSAPGHIRYLDVAAQRQVQIALGGAPAPFVGFDSSTMRYDPVRDLLVLTGSLGGKMALACLRCAKPEAGWFTPPLSQPVAAPDNASMAFDLVPEQGAYIVLSPADRHAVYAVQPPEGPFDPAATWTVTRRRVGGMELPVARVVGKRWSYCQAVRAFVWMASSTSPVVAYRP